MWPDPTKAAEAKLELIKLQQSGELAVIAGQMKINEIEAANPSMFVSGWRPAVGWICTIGLGMQFLIAPLITWGALVFGTVLNLPPLDMGILVTMLGGILGLGGLRTVEKVKGVERV
jgi:hypothetical protein